jgi:hypothetical protein
LYKTEELEPILSKISPHTKKSKYLLQQIMQNVEARPIVCRLLLSRKYKRLILFGRSEFSHQKTSNFKAFRGIIKKELN